MGNIGIVLYNVIIWTLCALVSLHSGNNSIKKHYNSTKKNYYIYFSLFLLYSLFTGFGGDNERYKYFVEGGYELVNQDGYTGIDPLYAYIAEFTNNNFLVWKFVVYGSCLIITFLTIRKFKVKNDITLMFYILMCLPSLGTTRAVLAYSIFLLGYSFISEKRTIPKIFGCLIIILSYFAHSSMIVPIILTPFTFIKIDKKIIYILVFLFPIFVYLFNNFYEIFLNEEYLYTSKFELYNENNYATERSITLNILNFMLYFIIIPPIYYGLKGLSNKSVSIHHKHVINFSFLLLYFSFIILFSELKNETFFNRYFTMIPFFLFITISEIIKENSFTSNKIRAYISIVTLHGFGLMYYILYCYLV